MTDPSALKREITAYIEGDDAAGNRICAALDSAVRDQVARFLGADDSDRDDMVQDSLLALLGYLRQAGSCPDNPEAFVVTIAGNRCRNLYQWRRRRPSIAIDATADFLPSDADSPLDMLQSAELLELLHDAFARLDAACFTLLKSIYLEERSIEELRQEAGIRSVQGIYYRKYACIKKLTRLFNQRWFGGRDSGESF